MFLSCNADLNFVYDSNDYCTLEMNALHPVYKLHRLDICQ